MQCKAAAKAWLLTVSEGIKANAFMHNTKEKYIILLVMKLCSKIEIPCKKTFIQHTTHISTKKEKKKGAAVSSASDLEIIPTFRYGRQKIDNQCILRYDFQVWK